MTSSGVAVIVVAAGSGSRLGHSEPKAFVALGGRTMLEHALGSWSASRRPMTVIIVAPESHLEMARTLAPDAIVVAGGDTRQNSVALGLAALPDDARIVLVHDAARALAPAELFDRVVSEVAATGAGVIPVMPVADTVKRVADGLVTDTLDRGALALVQTPQGFPRHVLEQAYAAAARDETDDAALVSAIGHPVRTITGDELAFKITTPADLERARILLASDGDVGGQRIGTGVDAHAFSEDPSVTLWLGGLDWPNEPGLTGHSDGDVVAHAIVDALLGAAGLGDIGAMFGTDDPVAAGAHADYFLQRTVDRLADEGFRVVNVSVELVGVRPKLAPRRAEVEARLTALVGGPVTVSATTTDGLGLTGEGRGIAAIATALLVH